MVIHLASDLDPDDAQEWLDSVNALVAAHGPRRARQVFAACSSAPDARILRWVEAYFAAHHAGDVEDFVEWVQDHQYSRSPNTGTATAPSQSVARKGADHDGTHHHRL
jgi:hypothetical protein